MQFIVNFLRGSVCFTVCGPFPERFLNLCAQIGVGFWGLVWLDAQTLELKVAPEGCPPGAVPRPWVFVLLFLAWDSPGPA